MRRVGVERLSSFFIFRFVGNDNLRKHFLVLLREAVCYSLSRRGFQIVQIAGFFLILHQPVAQKVERLGRKRLALRSSDALSVQIEQRFVHAYEPDGRKVVLPILAVPFFYFPQIKLGVRIKVCVGKLLQHLALDLKALFSDVHLLGEKFEKLFFCFGAVSEPRKVYSDHADRAGKRVGAQEPAAAAVKLGNVQTQAAAHGAGVLRLHVRVDKVAEVRDAVFGGDLPKPIEVRVIPIEVFCHVYRRNREGKHSARGVALSHDSEERAVEHIHFFLELAVSFFLFFAAYKNFLVFKVRRGRQVERDVGERRLESDARRHVHVEDKLLQRLLYFFVGELVVADKRR